MSTVTYPRTARAAIGLITTSVALALLATAQWFELVLVRSGQSPFCAIDETFDCAKVWDSAFASAVHGGTGIPVAGWGLIYALVALALSVRFIADAINSQDLSIPAQALRLTATGGVIGSVVLAGISANLGVFCLTCITTYVLTFAFAAVCFVGLPKVHESVTFGKPLVWNLGAAAVFFVLLLYPGTETPKSKASVEKSIMQTASAVSKDAPKSKAAKPAEEPFDPNATPEIKDVAEADIPDGFDEVAKVLAKFIMSIPREHQQLLADDLADLREAEARDTSRYSVRQRKGPAEAPVKIIEWTDALCGHCRIFVEGLNQVGEIFEQSAWSVEARHYPLDSECNPNVGMSDGSGARCLAAKAMICNEGTPQYWDLQKRLFVEQHSLDKAKIFEIAASGSVSSEKLRACIDSPDTATKLQEDIDYATQFNPEGTPVVVINGRKASPAAPLLYVMIQTGGDLKNPALDLLPKARPHGQRHQ